MNPESLYSPDLKARPGASPLGVSTGLLAMFFWQTLFFSAVYYCLTADNPFNFNNNYHLIAFITAWTVLFHLAFLFSLGNRQVQVHARKPLDQVDPECWQTTYVSVLTMIVLAVFPVALYFLVLDDFMITLRQWLSLIFAMGLYGYVFRKAGRLLLQPKGLFSRVVFTVVVVVFAVAVVQILAGMIPTAIRGSQGDVMLPL